MMRVQACYGGVPIVMSAPHFLKGDPYLWKNQVSTYSEIRL